MARHKYMVIYLGVDDGEIVDVYGTDNIDHKIGKIEASDPADDVVKDISINAFEPGSMPVLYTHESPGCRYVYHGGRWRRICT